MKRTCLIHVSGNRFPALSTSHHTARIWNELSKGFDEYHVVARSIDNHYRYSVSGDIHLHLLPGLNSRMWPFFFLSWLLPLYFWRLRPTHVLAQCPVMGGMAAAMCSQLFKVPLYIELHGEHYFRPARPGFPGRFESWIYRLLSRPAMNRARVIRSLSKNMSDTVGSTYGESALRKAVVVPNRVDLSMFSRTKDCYQCGNPLKIVSIGSFSPVKNHLALIEDLARSQLEVELTLVGSGMLKSEYERRSKEFGFHRRLSIRENLSHVELAAALPDFDIYVHYSLSEAFPRSVLEAMATGLPVVATRVGFFEGELVDGDNAILIDSPHGEHLRSAIERLTRSFEFRQKVGRAARKTVEERFDWGRAFEQYRGTIRAMQW